MKEKLHLVSTYDAATVTLERVAVAVVTHVDSVHDTIPECQVTVGALVQLRLLLLTDRKLRLDMGHDARSCLGPRTLGLIGDSVHAIGRRDEGHGCGRERDRHGRR